MQLAFFLGEYPIITQATFSFSFLKVKIIHLKNVFTIMYEAYSVGVFPECFLFIFHITLRVPPVPTLPCKAFGGWGKSLR